MSKFALFLLPALLVAALPAGADTKYQADVVRVLDGDTVEVLDSEKTTHRIRLANIDAPERRQAFGERARQSLADLTYRQHVEVLDKGGDRYGRRIAVLTLRGKNINAEMVRRGLAWVYERYNSDPGLPALEGAARAGRLGLWADAQPVAPWEFRRAKH